MVKGLEEDDDDDDDVSIDTPVGLVSYVMITFIFAFSYPCLIIGLLLVFANYFV